MPEFLLFLRMIHILSGIFWAGSAFMLSFFILPAIQASEPEGSKVMRQIVITNHYPTIMTTASTLNIISGLFLFWQISNGLQLSWMHSGTGYSLSIGSITAMLAFALGLIINRPCGIRISQIGIEIAKAKNTPDVSLLVELSSLKSRITRSTNYIAALLSITAITMSIAKYINL